MREQGKVDRNSNDGDRVEMPRSPTKKEAMERGGNHLKFSNNFATICFSDKTQIEKVSSASWI